MLVNTAQIEPVNAEKEVKRYTKTPTQPMSYLIGKIEILKLREEYKKRQGDNFNLKDFHNRLLSYGSIPVELIKQQIAIDN